MRRRRSEIRETIPDPLYNDLMVTRLINSIMWDGKKAVAQKVVYGAFDVIREKREGTAEVFKRRWITYNRSSR